MPNRYPNEKHFEQIHRIYRRTSIIGTIKMFDFIVDECKIDCFIDFAQKVILRYKLFDADEFQLCLLGSLTFQHTQLYQLTLYF